MQVHVDRRTINARDGSTTLCSRTVGSCSLRKEVDVLWNQADKPLVCLVQWRHSMSFVFVFAVLAWQVFIGRDVPD